MDQMLMAGTTGKETTKADWPIELSLFLDNPKSWVSI
jgi:hypothetical protein